MNELATTSSQEISAELLEKVVITGDLSKLSSNDRMQYYASVCKSVGLNPLTKPFDYITLNGKLVLYANKNCTDQLRRIHNVKIEVKSRERLDDVYVVTARASNPSGREDEEIGAVNIANLKGDSLANALMKATTKAKRRVTLSICGLGMLDESEIETIPGAQPVDPDVPDLSEDSVFAEQWHSALAARPPQFTMDETRSLMEKFLVHNKTALDALGIGARQKLIAEAKSGAWDKYADKMRAAQPAAA